MNGRIIVCINQLVLVLRKFYKTELWVALSSKVTSLKPISFHKLTKMISKRWTLHILWNMHDCKDTCLNNLVIQLSNASFLQRTYWLLFVQSLYEIWLQLAKNRQGALYLLSYSVFGQKSTRWCQAKLCCYYNCIL